MDNFGWAGWTLPASGCGRGRPGGMLLEALPTCNAIPSLKSFEHPLISLGVMPAKLNFLPQYLEKQF